MQKGSVGFLDFVGLQIGMDCLLREESFQIQSQVVTVRQVVGQIPRLWDPMPE